LLYLGSLFFPDNLQPLGIGSVFARETTRRPYHGRNYVFKVKGTTTLLVVGVVKSNVRNLPVVGDVDHELLSQFV
jgi:hypothetical protein